jgi:hypothetical protein
MSYETAIATNSTFAGHSDWRLPTVEELVSLVDYKKTDPALNSDLFPNTPGWFFWSGSPFADGSRFAWLVFFDFGRVEHHNGYGGGSYVRLVRTGQSLASFALSASATGTGSGILTSNTGGLNCTRTAGTTSGTCTANLASGASVTLTAITATSSIFTGWGGACSGSNPLCTLTMDAAKSVSASFSSGLAPQTIAFDPGPTGVSLGFSFSVRATASSGLPVVFSSLTPDICTVSGSTVSGVSAGICTLAANQAGDSTYAAAPQATLSFIINAAAIGPPSPPTITSIKAGSGSATIDFTAHSNTGGSPITSFTASCTATGQTTRTAIGSASPLTIRNLTGGVVYQCSLTATNGAGLSSTASASLPVTPMAGKKTSLTPILMLLLD